MNEKAFWKVAEKLLDNVGIYVLVIGLLMMGIALLLPVNKFCVIIFVLGAIATSGITISMIYANLMLYVLRRPWMQ